MTDDEDQLHTVLFCTRCGEWEVDRVGPNPSRCYHCTGLGRQFVRFYDSQGTEVSELLFANWRLSGRTPYVIPGLPEWRPGDLKRRIPWL